MAPRPADSARFLGGTIFGAVVVGPLAWTIERGSIAGYWTLADGGPVSYLLANFSTYIGQFGIHDIFLETPYGQLRHRSAINGSIWSLYFEIAAVPRLAALGGLGAGAGPLAGTARRRRRSRGHPARRPGACAGAGHPRPVRAGLGSTAGAIFLLGASAALYSDN